MLEGHFGGWAAVRQDFCGGGVVVVIVIVVVVVVGLMSIMDILGKLLLHSPLFRLFFA